MKKGILFFVASLAFAGDSLAASYMSMQSNEVNSECLRLRDANLLYVSKYKISTKDGTDVTEYFELKNCYPSKNGVYTWFLSINPENELWEKLHGELTICINNFGNENFVFRGRLK